MRESIDIRPLGPDDVEATYRAASFALHESPEEKERLKNRSPEEAGHRKDRYRHFLRHDPAGA